MAFLQDVKDAAHKRAGGKCECTRKPVHITLVVVMQVLFMASGKPTTSFRNLREEQIRSLIAKPYAVLVIKIPGVTEAKNLVQDRSHFP